MLLGRIEARQHRQDAVAVAGVLVQEEAGGLIGGLDPGGARRVVEGDVVLLGLLLVRLRLGLLVLLLLLFGRDFNEIAVPERRRELGCHSYRWHAQRDAGRVAEGTRNVSGRGRARFGEQVLLQLQFFEDFAVVELCVDVRELINTFGTDNITLSTGMHNCPYSGGAGGWLTLLCVNCWKRHQKRWTMGAGGSDNGAGAEVGVYG